MPDKKAKAVKPWFVLKSAGDDLYSVAYRGPDRSKARATAEKILADPKDATAVLVIRASVLTSVTREDLKASLPRDAF